MAMKLPIFTIFACLAFVACGEESPSSTSVDASDTVMAATNEPAVVTSNVSGSDYIASVESSLHSQMKLFSRVSPEAAALIRPVSLNAQDRDVIRCAVQGLEKAGLVRFVTLSMETNQTLNRMIENNPELSMRTIEQTPEALAIFEGDALTKEFSEEETDLAMRINQDCGVTKMMTSKMTESGMMEAMRVVMAED